jgi:hypothetical protein
MSWWLSPVGQSLSRHRLAWSAEQDFAGTPGGTAAGRTEHLKRCSSLAQQHARKINLNGRAAYGRLFVDRPKPRNGTPSIAEHE